MNALQGVDPARLVFLLVLLALVATGVLRLYGGRIGTGLRDALIWGLIFVGLILAFGMRQEIVAALSPDQPMVTEAGEVQLRRSADGHFRARATVNGAPVTFLVDTGASGVVLTADDARAAGFHPDKLAFTGRAYTANGEARLAPVRIDRLTLGPIEAHDIRASVSQGGLFSSLLGMDFLDRFARVTVEGDRMTLTP